METIKLKTHVGDDGLLKLELPTGVTNRELEVLVVMQPLEDEEVDDLGWPIGYFEETYGSMAHEPMQRGDQGEYKVRDELM